MSNKKPDNSGLKELLKPPFTWDYDYLCCSDDVLFETTSSHFHKSDIYIELHEFVIRALNNEYELEYGEPLRWKLETAIMDGREVFWTKCPKCDCRTSIGEIYYHYCPSCGQRLLPPEKEK